VSFSGAFQKSSSDESFALVKVVSGLLWIEPATLIKPALSPSRWGG
jgi:hypothetical protein